jgi:hypothetical protein
MSEPNWQTSLHIVILEDAILLTKKHYDSWWEIQDEYHATFKASLGPWEACVVAEWIAEEYDPPPWSTDEIAAFLMSEELTLIYSFG